MIATTETINKPGVGRKTEETPQRWPIFTASLGYGTVPPNVESLSPSVVWPGWGWGALLCGNYPTYRTMCRWRTIPYVLSQVLGPVLGGSWVPDADKDAPDEPVQWLKDNIIAPRGAVIAHACRSIIYGNAGFETVWDVAAGKYIVKQFVPLLQDNTNVRRENNGRGPFAGLENGQAKLSPAECLYILNRSDALSDEPGDDYGRSRLENIRDSSWIASLDTMRRLAELEDRVSGVVLVWEVPKTGPDEEGKTMAQRAQASLPELMKPRSNGVAIENPALGEADADTEAGKYKQLQSQLNPLDMGNRVPGQSAMLEKLKNLDEKMGEGLYRGARTLFATQGGTKADAEQHTANAEPDCEAIDAMICSQINEQTCRTGLTMNFGPDVLKKVRGIKPVPLVDQDQQRATDTLDAMLGNPQLAVALGQTIDVDKLLERARLPARKDAKFGDALTTVMDAAQKAKEAAAMQRQPVNGNGKPVDPRVARAAKRFAASN